MKKLFLTTLLALSVSLSFAQNAPAKLLKGIDTTTDEFTGAVTYSAKDCCLSVIQSEDAISIRISLACSSFDTPVKLNKIYILTNGQTTIIEHDDDFTSKETPTRVMSKPATGKFGTSSYRGAEFETRIQYIDIWNADALPYMSMIESIIQNLGKVKFEGDNNTLFLEFNKKSAAKMETVLQLYKYLIKE